MSRRDWAVKYIKCYKCGAPLRVLRTIDGFIKVDAAAVTIKPGEGYRANGKVADREEKYGFKLHACEGGKI